jgi:hypothetical protein
MTIAHRFKYTPYLKKPNWFTAVFGPEAHKDAHFILLWNGSHEAFRREYRKTFLRWERMFGKDFTKRHLPFVFRRAKRLGMTADMLLRFSVELQGREAAAPAKEAP